MVVDTPIVGSPPFPGVDARQLGDFKGQSPLPSTGFRKYRARYQAAVASVTGSD
jgi:hypothetical protein